MDISLSKFIDNEFHKIKNIKIIKFIKKKKLFQLQDNIVTFNFILDKKNKPYCSICNNNLLCYHFLKILIDWFNLSDFSISFLLDMEIYSFFLENINNTNLNILLESKIYDYIHNIECGICLDNLKINKNDFTKGLHKCKTCKKYIHTKCNNQWNETSKSNLNREKCIYCLT